MAKHWDSFLSYCKSHTHCKYCFMPQVCWGVLVQNQKTPWVQVSKCAHSLAHHHHASWDPVPATNLNPRLVSVLTSHGPNMHSISATIAPLSFYTLVRQSCHFHLFGLIKPWYPRDPRLYFIYPSHLLSFLHFLCTRNLLCCFISSSSQFWTFQCKS